MDHQLLIKLGSLIEAVTVLLGNLNKLLEKEVKKK